MYFLQSHLGNALSLAFSKGHEQKDRHSVALVKATQNKVSLPPSTVLNCAGFKIYHATIKIPSFQVLKSNVVQN